MAAEMTAKKWSYAGLFAITLATLMYEILLTRIFSVTMWYHFAFMAVSVALFGMTVGAIAVYLLPGFFTAERTKQHIAAGSLLFSVSIVLSFIAHLRIPFAPSASLAGLAALACMYVVIAIPFVFSGLCVCLALTRFPRQVSRLYAADLAGAAAGCIALICTLKLTDGPTAVFVVALLASLGAVAFAAEAGARNLVRTGVLCVAFFACFAAVHTVLVARQAPLLRISRAKGRLEGIPLYERWNSFSRVQVYGNPDRFTEPRGWGLSTESPRGHRVRQLSMNIDASALTYLTHFDGNYADLEHLKYDVTNMAHYVRRDAKVLVVGTGGGRDILSALVFRQKSVCGIEINREVIDAVNRVFGDFTGHLDRDPRITFVNDEARSWITRSRDKFDIIQISLIDTWAATAAGAFVLSENSLYTIEAWRIFLDHLAPNGVLTVSRWCIGNSPAEIYRLTLLACASLEQRGIRDPRNHIIIVRHQPRPSAGNEPEGIATLLVSKEPFTDHDANTIAEVAAGMQFTVMLAPRTASDSTLEAIASGANLTTFAAKFPVNISAPTDDSPFFFHMLRLRDLLHRGPWQGQAGPNVNAVFVLGALLVIVVVLTVVCILGPLILATTKGSRTGGLPLFAFFACIGLGFMMVEISQMQRLIVFLGHPTYGLSVVLFVLLLSGGLGSYSTGRTERAAGTGPIVRLLLLIGALIAFGLATPCAVRTFEGAVTPVRIAVAIAILFPLGFLMGMAFPLGMKVASARSASMTPWLWGTNGAASVCASVLAVAVALSAGISAAFWTGCAFYVLAVGAFVWARRPAPAGDS